MEPAQLIKLAITASVVLLVFGLGLRATFADATSLFRDAFRPPYRLLRALAAMYVVVPVVAVAVALLIDPSKPIRAALLAMAVAPIPPLLPGKQLKFGGQADYVFGLLVAISLASVVMVPLVVAVIGWAFGREAAFGPDEIAKLIAATVLGPLLAGLAVRKLAPRIAERIAPWVSRLGNVVLFAALAPVLVKAWPAVVSLIGNGAILAIVLVVASAIAAGHWVGGPDSDERTTLAIASAMRHPGIALAIATFNIPDEPRIPAAVLLYLLVAIAATTLYGALRKRQLAPAG